MSLRWLLQSGRRRQARYPRGLTSMILHNRATGISLRCSSTKANLVVRAFIRTDGIHVLILSAKNTVAFFLERPSPPGAAGSLCAVLRPRAQGRIALLASRGSCVPAGSIGLALKSQHRSQRQPACGKARSSMRLELLLRGTPGSVVMPCLFSFATRYAVKGAEQFRDRSQVDWFNNRLLLQPIGNIPPAEAEVNFYAALKHQTWRRN